MLTLRHFVSPAILEPLEAELDAGLAAGTITHREVMEREFSMLTVPLNDVVAFLVECVRVRPGFAAFRRSFRSADPLVELSRDDRPRSRARRRDGARSREPRRCDARRMA